MFFTQEDYRKIEKWLQRNSVKDTEFQEALPLNGTETVALVQGGHNKKVLVKDLADIISKKVLYFLNVTDKYDASYITLVEAIRLIPLKDRKVGLVITFLNTDGNWQIYQFKGVLNQWNQLNLWENLFDWGRFAINSILPDEEDLTKSLPDADGNSYLSFKDREYNPEDFSGFGRVILRKNIVEVEDPIYGKVKKNVLNQDMINQANTIYVIQYDFTLGGNITIPANCVLKFNGGSFSNGTLVGNETILVYNREEEDVFKNVSLEGSFERSTSAIADKKDNTNGMATITLKKNKSFASQLTQANTIYRIMYDFTLSEMEKRSVTLSNSDSVFIGITNKIDIQQSDSVEINGTTYYYKKIGLRAKNTINILNKQLLFLSSDKSSILDVNSIIAENSDEDVYIASLNYGEFSSAYKKGMTYYHSQPITLESNQRIILNESDCFLIDENLTKRLGNTSIMGSWTGYIASTTYGVYQDAYSIGVWNTVTIPENSILRFDGGALHYGTLKNTNNSRYYIEENGTKILDFVIPTSLSSIKASSFGMTITNKKDNALRFNFISGSVKQIYLDMTSGLVNFTENEYVIERPLILYFNGKLTGIGEQSNIATILLPTKDFKIKFPDRGIVETANYWYELDGGMTSGGIDFFWDIWVKNVNIKIQNNSDYGICTWSLCNGIFEDIMITDSLKACYNTLGTNVMVSFVNAGGSVFGEDTFIYKTGRHPISSRGTSGSVGAYNISRCGMDASNVVLIAAGAALNISNCRIEGLDRMVVVDDSVQNSTVAPAIRIDGCSITVGSSQLPHGYKVLVYGHKGWFRLYADNVIGGPLYAAVYYTNTNSFDGVNSSNYYTLPTVLVRNYEAPYFITPFLRVNKGIVTKSDEPIIYGSVNQTFVSNFDNRNNSGIVSDTNECFGLFYKGKGLLGCAPGIGPLILSSSSKYVLDAKKVNGTSRPSSISYGGKSLTPEDGYMFFDTSIKKPIWRYSGKWVESDSATAGVARSGNTSGRPVGSSIYVGFMYMDTEIGKPIYASAIRGDTVTWIDVTGTTV